MNYIDVALIVIIVVIGFRGFAAGFIAEFSSLVGILLGVYLGALFAYPIGEALKGIYNFNSVTIHLALGFLITLLVCWCFFVLIGIVLGRKVHFLGALDFLDKSLGFVFSSIKTFFIFSFIAYGISHINFLQDNFIKAAQEKSQMYVNMIKVAQKIVHLPAVDEISQNLSNIKDGKPNVKTMQEGVEKLKNDAFGGK